MLYCERCRVKRNLRRPANFPHIDMYSTECELCHIREWCYDQHAIYAKQKKDWSFEEKHLDKMIQHDYHQKAEELIIALGSGRYAGAMDHVRTEEIKRAVTKVNGEIDWYATFELRQRLQKLYKKVDELKRNGE